MFYCGIHGACPNCGYCPCCGRGSYPRVYPWQSKPWWAQWGGTVQQTTSLPRVGVSYNPTLGIVA